VDNETDDGVIVAGAAVTELPKDLFIPPDALKVILESFQGPLDLLLYLIRKQNIDILDINVAEITRQYMSYIEMMHSLELELASEYLVMAATLAEIKSRMLLPRSSEHDDDDEDPRAALIRRLQEYERFKAAALRIDNLPRVGREIYLAEPASYEPIVERTHPDVYLGELSLAFAEALKRASMFESHQVAREQLSTRERMSQILDRLAGRSELSRFSDLFDGREGRQGVVVTFLAIMELIKESLLDIVQSEQFGEIRVKRRQEDAFNG
jgi:segregation and condensation protein A